MYEKIENLLQIIENITLKKRWQELKELFKYLPNETVIEKQKDRFNRLIDLWGTVTMIHRKYYHQLLKIQNDKLLCFAEIKRLERHEPNDKGVIEKNSDFLRGYYTAKAESFRISPKQLRKAEEQVDALVAFGKCLRRVLKKRGIEK